VVCRGRCHRRGGCYMSRQHNCALLTGIRCEQRFDDAAFPSAVQAGLMAGTPLPSTAHAGLIAGALFKSTAHAGSIAGAPLPSTAHAASIAGAPLPSTAHAASIAGTPLPSTAQAQVHSRRTWRPGSAGCPLVRWSAAASAHPALIRQSARLHASTRAHKTCLAAHPATLC